MNDIVMRPAVNLSEDWMILVFLFTLVTIAYTRRFHPQRILRLWNSTWNVRILRQAIREEPNTPRANLLFNLSFYILTSLIAYMAVVYFHAAPFGLHGFTLFISILGCVLLIYGIKMLGIRAVQLVADGDFGLSEYEYNVFLINRVIGLFLFPLTLFLAYAPLTLAEPSIQASLIVYACMVIYRIFRGFLTAANSGVPVFYIFFYICTLEILPLMVFLKIILSKSVH